MRLFGEADYHFIERRKRAYRVSTAALRWVIVVGVLVRSLLLRNSLERVLDPEIPPSDRLLLAPTSPLSDVDFGLIPECAHV